MLHIAHTRRDGSFGFAAFVECDDFTTGERGRLRFNATLVVVPVDEMGPDENRRHQQEQKAEQNNEKLLHGPFPWGGPGINFPGIADCHVEAVARRVNIAKLMKPAGTGKRYPRKGTAKRLRCSGNGTAMGELINLEEFRSERERRSKEETARKRRRDKKRDKPSSPPPTDKVEDDPA